jgi:hypothetical protein
MRHTLLLTTALCAMTTSLLLTTAQATPLSGLASSPNVNQSLIEKARMGRPLLALAAHLRGPLGLGRLAIPSVSRPAWLLIAAIEGAGAFKAPALPVGVRLPPCRKQRRGHAARGI